MSSGGGKSEFLNLTPFIDLFSTLIIFLIMTAVWNSIEALSTNVENITSDPSSTPDNPPPKKVALSAAIMPDRVEFAEDDKSEKIPMVNGEIDVNAIGTYLAVWRAKYPDRKDIILNTANTVPYRHMITVFDTLVGNGWPDVGVNTQ